MSSDQSSPNTETNPEVLPFHKVEWRGSVANIFDSTAIQSAPETEALIYDRSDFQSPLERVQITTQSINVDGESATAFTAKIRLDRARDDYLQGRGSSNSLLSPFLKGNIGDAEFIPYDNKDKDLIIEPTAFGSVHSISHSGGTKVLVWIDGKNKQIIVSNNLSLNHVNDAGEVTLRVEVTPPIDGTVDKSEALDGFLKAFMRTMDYTAGLTQSSYNPASTHLNRTYPIGKEVSEARPAARPASIGRHAVSGTATSKELGGNKSTLPNRGVKAPSNAVEDLPEVEVLTPELSLDEIGGLEQVKKSLRDIAISFNHPEVMEKWGAKRPQGVLLYGEPGTGKTMLARALANEIGAEMWALQSTDIYEAWLGSSEQRIKKIFDYARSHKGRLIIFFDEFDSIVGTADTPTSGGDRARNAVAGIFKQEMNTLAQDNPNVLIVAATNNLDGIDPALVRSGRFDHKVYVPMPDEDARQQIVSTVVANSILRQETEDFRVFGDDLNVVKLATETDGMSGADITEIFRRLGLTRAMQEARTGQQQEPIKQDEIIQEIRKFRTVG